MRDNLKEDPSKNNLYALCADLNMKRSIVKPEMESFNLMIEKEQKAAQELQKSLELLHTPYHMGLYFLHHRYTLQEQLREQLSL